MEQGNGLVNGELADPGYPQYLSLSCPAEDIPEQARTVNWTGRTANTLRPAGALTLSKGWKPCAAF